MFSHSLWNEAHTTLSPNKNTDIRRFCKTHITFNANLFFYNPTFLKFLLSVMWWKVMIMVTKKANVNYKFVKGKSNSLYGLHHPNLHTLTSCIGYESWGARSSNMDVIPTDAGMEPGMHNCYYVNIGMWELLAFASASKINCTGRGSSHL